MKPRRLYRSPYTVPHLILRRAEAWACVVWPTLAATALEVLRRLSGLPL